MDPYPGFYMYIFPSTDIPCAACSICVMSRMTRLKKKLFLFFFFFLFSFLLLSSFFSCSFLRGVVMCVSIILLQHTAHDLVLCVHVYVSFFFLLMRSYLHLFTVTDTMMNFFSYCIFI